MHSPTSSTTSFVLNPATLPPGVGGTMQANALQLEATSSAVLGTYQVEVGTNGCATDSTAAVSVTIIPFQCIPSPYCLNEGVPDGVQCGTVPDGCGGGNCARTHSCS